MTKYMGRFGTKSKNLSLRDATVELTSERGNLNFKMNRIPEITYRECLKLQ